MDGVASSAAAGVQVAARGGAPSCMGGSAGPAASILGFIGASVFTTCELITASLRMGLLSWG